MSSTAISGGHEYDRTQELKRFDESKMGVKGLSDSGITSIPKFFIHPPQALADININKGRSLPSSEGQISIPVIDLSGVESAEQRPGIVEKMKEAASTWGFFQVVNHGVPVEDLESAIGAIEAFHEQPPEVKSKYYKRDAELGGVMYTSNNDLYRSEAAAWHDSLQAWMGPTPVNPEELPEICRNEVVAWDKQSNKLGETVMELLGEGLGLDSSKFKELSFSETRVLVGHCYPYCPEPDLTVGITSHTDPGIITVLLQNQVGGLQVKHEEYGWVDVRPLHGGVIINVGDFLQIISNGVYKSVQHRVSANGSKTPRISVVEFFNLSKWREADDYGPLPELLSPEKPAIYRDFTMQEFNENFYSKGLDSKSFIEKIKIRG